MGSAHRQPVVTGTSVLGIKFKDGVVMAADMLGVSARPRKVDELLTGL